MIGRVFGNHLEVEEEGQGGISQFQISIVPANRGRPGPKLAGSFGENGEREKIKNKDQHNNEVIGP